MSLAVACCAVLAATGCSSTPTTTPDTTTASSGAAVTSTAKAVSAEALCDYLRSQVPVLKGIGSEVGAMANLTVNLYSWYEKQGAVPSGSQIDELTRQQCPEVGKEVLKLAGIQSFATL